MESIRLEEIKIKNYFLNTIPNENKLEKYRTYYKENGMQAKPIKLNRNGFLIDGYIQYIILKENKSEYAAVIYKENHASQHSTLTYDKYPNRLEQKAKLRGCILVHCHKLCP